MNKTITDKWADIITPFYYYDVDLLKQTIETAKKEAENVDIFCITRQRQMPTLDC
jgi:hypothetical protein